MIRHIIFVGAMALAMPAGAYAQGVPVGLLMALASVSTMLVLWERLSAASLAAS